MTVIERRKREALQFGEVLTTEAASHQRRGYVLGNLTLDGEFTEAQHEAGIRYAQDMARYYRTCLGRYPSARAQNLNGVNGHDGEVSEDEARAARDAANTFMRLEQLLLNDVKGRERRSAVFEICVMDNEFARTWPAHMLEFARCGLNELIWHYGLEKFGK